MRIREPMRTHIIDTINRVDHRNRREAVGRAVLKWESKMLPDGCIREYNRPPLPNSAGFVDDCRCQGCLERDVAKLLEMLQANAKLPPEEWR